MTIPRQRRNSVESWVSSDNPNGISSILAAADANLHNRITSGAMQESNRMEAPNALMVRSSSSLSEDATRDQARRDKYLSKIHQASHAEKLKRYLQENKLTLSDINAMSLQQVYYTWRVLDRRFRSSAKHKNTKVQVKFDYHQKKKKKKRKEEEEEEENEKKRKEQSGPCFFSLLLGTQSTCFYVRMYYSESLCSAAS